MPCQKYVHENDVKIANKRPRNLLKKYKKCFINGKQVKTDKITQIIPWFSQFYAKTTTGNSHAHMYAPTVTFARWWSVCEFATPAHGALGLQLAAPWNWVVQWVVDISVFQYSRCSYKTLQTMLKPTLIDCIPSSDCYTCFVERYAAILLVLGLHDHSPTPHLVGLLASHAFITDIILLLLRWNHTYIHSDTGTVYQRW